MPSTILPLAAPEFAPEHLLLLVGVGALAAALNTLAGGGSLVSFPVLVALGVPPVAANATNAFALTVGGISGALGFVGALGRTGHHLARLAAPTLVGAVAGAWLLLHTSERLFDVVVPALLLIATALIALRDVLGGRPDRGTAVQRGTARAAPLLVFAASVYGGYFGAGMGIVFLAILGWFMPGDLHQHNAVKNWLQCLINVVAAGVFFAQGVVLVAPALALMAGGVVGGYASATLSQRVDPGRLRRAVTIYGAAMTLWFVGRALWAG